VSICDKCKWRKDIDFPGDFVTDVCINPKSYPYIELSPPAVYISCSSTWEECYKFEEVEK